MKQKWWEKSLGNQIIAENVGTVYAHFRSISSKVNCTDSPKPFTLNGMLLIYFFMLQFWTAIRYFTFGYYRLLDLEDIYK